MENTETKVCKVCGVEKPQIMFRKYTGKSYTRNKCLECENTCKRVCNITEDERIKINNDRRYYSVANKERVILITAKGRAKREGFDFNLTIEDIVIPDVCPVLGIPIVKGFIGHRGACDNSPSLDRIDNTKGYVKGNVMVISYRANLIKSIGNADDHRKIAEYIEKNSLLTSSSQSLQSKS